MLDDTMIQDDSPECGEVLNTTSFREWVTVPVFVALIFLGDSLFWESPYENLIKYYYLPNVVMASCLMYTLVKILGGRIRSISLGMTLSMLILPFLGWAILVYQEYDNKPYKHVIAFFMWFFLMLGSIAYSDYLFGQWHEHKYQVGIPEKILAIYFAWALPLYYSLLYLVGITKKFRQSRLASQGA